MTNREYIDKMTNSEFLQLIFSTGIECDHCPAMVSCEYGVCEVAFDKWLGEKA